MVNTNGIQTSEQQCKYENGQGPKSTRKWLARAAVFLLVILVCLVLVWIRWSSRSANERIAAFEAARAIPDEENAAVLYGQLFETSDVGADAPGFFATSHPSATSGPWLSAEHPETAEWIKGHQSTIAKLMEASRREKCALAIDLDPGPTNQHMKLLAEMRQWAQLLVSAANNDIAEGRTDAGIEKYLCIIRMAKQLDQQPILVDFLVSIALEALALIRMKPFILEGDITKEGLDTVENALPAPQVDREERLAAAFEFERLYAKKHLGLLHRIALLFRRDDRRALDRVKELCRRVRAERRGMHILIALRRYKDQHGRWPNSLDDIKDLTAAENFVDPMNDESFVYKLTDDGFKIYSKGKNKIDEDGDRKGDAADWPIWPPRDRTQRQTSSRGE
ncbi:MAG: hypothetical protein ACYS29_11240 [Planctomycetota bacterium]